jgi:hypothetical protein
MNKKQKNPTDNSKETPLVEPTAAINVEKKKILPRYSKQEYAGWLRQLRDIRIQIAKFEERAESIKSELRNGFKFETVEGTTETGRPRRQRIELDGLMVGDLQHQLRELQINIANYKVDEKSMRDHFDMISKSVKYYDKLDLRVIKANVRVENNPKQYIEEVLNKIEKASYNGLGKTLTDLKMLAAKEPYPARQMLNNLLTYIDHTMHEVLKQNQALRKQLFDRYFGPIPEKLQKKRLEKNLQIEYDPEKWD